MGTDINPHELMGIIWRFLNRSLIKCKRFEHGVNAADDVRMLPSSPDL